MDKLKKLGKYFTKGLQAGVLATTLIAGNVSCSNSVGGSTVEYPIVTPPTLPKDDTESTWPSYYINKDFGGQQFVEKDANWYNSSNGNQEFTAHYNTANEFINKKVKELQKLWQEKNTGSTLSNQINITLNSFNKGSTIAAQINNNYNALAPVFGIMTDNLLDNAENIDFNRFNVSYYKLAADAFNQSVGKLAEGENKKNFTTNTELIDDSSNFFASELNDAKLSYADATNRNNAVNRMNGYLNTIATKTNTNLDVLKKVVELALYNESLYGLNDFTVVCGVFNQGLTTTKRRLDIFQTAINNATYSISNVQNLDDRTM